MKNVSKDCSYIHPNYNKLTVNNTESGVSYRSKKPLKITSPKRSNSCYMRYLRRLVNQCIGIVTMKALILINIGVSI